MLVSFNPYTSNNRSKRQSPNFKCLQNGIIEPALVSRYASDAEKCGNYIYGGLYKPTDANLKALLDAKKIAANDEYTGLEKMTFLDEAIAILRQKAEQVGISLSI